MLLDMDKQLDIKIRLARFEEAAAIAEIIFYAFEDKRSFYTDAAFALTTPNASEIEERVKNKTTWVAVNSDRVMGTVGGFIKGEAWFIRSLAVDRNCRRHGIASMLMNHMEKLALINDRRYITLTTCSFLVPACQLYESMGFVYDGYEDLAGTELIKMKKLVNPFSSKIKLQKHDHIK